FLEQNLLKKKADQKLSQGSPATNNLTSKFFDLTTLAALFANIIELNVDLEILSILKLLFEYTLFLSLPIEKITR
ncbi:MAG: hypothetical protein O2823_04755, partial [Actinomycetota bacterium]|nr:hypothetical protein [Actinomycetota bacterium]